MGSSVLAGLLPRDPRNRKLLLVLLLALCAMTATMLAHGVYTSWYVLETRVVDVRLTVTEEQAMGFDLNDTTLSFGKVPRGGTASRGVVLSADVPAQALLTVDPSLAGWVSVGQARVPLSPGTPVVVDVAATVPANAPFGTYTGALRIRYTRKLF
jgi:hypothetical protein